MSLVDKIFEVEVLVCLVYAEPYGKLNFPKCVRSDYIMIDLDISGMIMMPKCF